MRVLMTGHNGYLGSVMAPHLQAAGHEVVGLDTYFFEDCTFGGDGQELPCLRKDVRDIMPPDLQGFDAVIHLAALSNDPLGDLNAEWTYEINYEASVRLAKNAREAGVRRFLFASSCSMYGAATSEELVTESAPLRPITPYAVSKVRAEEAISKLAHATFSPVFLRNATAYGVSPRLRADVVLNNLVCWAYTTGWVRITSDGTPWRPIVHVEDIAQAFAAILNAPREHTHNQAFNVGANSENYQVRELARIVRETVPGCTVECTGETGPDPRSYRVDFRKLATTFPDFQFKWNARLGVEQLQAACQQVGLTLERFQGRHCLRLPQLKHLLATGRLDNNLRWRN